MTRILFGLAVLLGACASPQYEPCLTEGAGAGCACPEGEHAERKSGSTTLHVCTPDDDSVSFTHADAMAAPDTSRVDAATVPPDAAKEAATCVPSPEVCNGRDDDCDQAVDEDVMCTHRVSSSGLYTCSVQADRTGTCWGRNQDGALGNGGEDDSKVPVKVMMSEIASIAAASFHTCAISGKGEVSCWGNNEFGQLGDGGPLPAAGEPKFRPTPKTVALPGSARDVTVGSWHSCAALKDGSVYCWGKNDGRFGDGAGAASSSPVKVGGVSDVIALAAGNDHTCALLATRKVSCWGENKLGQLGDGTPAARDKPVVTAFLANIVELAADGNHTCALGEDGVVQCWGYILRTKRFRDAPEVIALSEPAVHIGAGFDHDCAIGESGKLWCWGANDSGQLGDNTTADSEAAVEVLGLSGPVELALGVAHSCARKNDGKVLCWGIGYGGALGDGTAMDRLTPVEVLFAP